MAKGPRPQGLFANTTAGRLAAEAKARKRTLGDVLKAAGINTPRPAKAKAATSAKGRTSRRPKTNRVDRTRAGGEWTEAAFWSFVRSGLRGMSRRWPPIVRQALHAARRPLVPKRGNQKWEYCCALCGEWFKYDDVKVDHITPVGSLRSFGDVEGFVRRLFCEVDGLRVVCVVCHEKRHALERIVKAAEDRERKALADWDARNEAGFLFDIHHERRDP